MKPMLKAILLKKMLLGVASKKEKQRVYFSEESEQMLRHEWSSDYSSIARDTPFDKQKLLRSINHKVATNKNISWYQRPIFSYAASITLIAALSGAAYFMIWTKSNADTEYETIFSGTNIAQEVVLPDGSLVILNKGTQLRFPKQFSKKNRMVQLSGEGLFDVTHNPHKPFIVSANGVRIEVLGTKFNVMAYTSHDMVATTLISGKVKVIRLDPQTRKEQSVTLSPNHTATIILSQNRFEITSGKVNATTSWVNGQLIFEDEPLERMLLRLGKWYGIDFALSDEIKGSYRMSMTIDNESLDEALLIITKTLPVGYTRVNGKILFYPKK